MMSTEEQHVTQMDWGALPKDILQSVFAQVFKHPPTSDHWPLKAAILQVVALNKICRHWSAVLAQDPPALNLLIDSLDTLPRKWVPPRFTINSLQIISNDTMAVESVMKLIGTRWLPDCAVAPYLGTTLPNSILKIGCLTHLQVLSIDCPEVCEEQAGIMFSFAPLAQLTTLSVVSLKGFNDYVDLDVLPTSVKTLTLVYAQRHRAHSHSHSSAISIPPPLSQGTMLDSLRIEKDGVVGLNLENVWGCCRVVEVDARVVMVGVPVVDPETVAVFERPYREGAYVPPHILGDWDAVEASNMAADVTGTHLLHGVASSVALHTLRFMGKGAASVKMVPGRSGLLSESVAWLHSVVAHANSYLYLYGFSGAELVARLLDMQQREGSDVPPIEIELDSDGGGGGVEGEGSSGFEMVVVAMKKE